MITQLSEGKVTRDEIICYITEWHLDEFGGYPFDCEWFGDTLVVAELDPGKDMNRTFLAHYKKDDIDKAVKIANEQVDNGWDKEEAIVDASMDLNRTK